MRMLAQLQLVGATPLGTQAKVQPSQADRVSLKAHLCATDDLLFDGQQQQQQQ